MCDLLNHCISYPQFVEVLCCLMAARSVSILEPDVKQIRGLALDEEMQVGTRDAAGKGLNDIATFGGGRATGVTA